MDISRVAFDPHKHWDSLRVHQGSVASDDDFNEADTITEEDRRRTRVDVIGPDGSPDQGFLIANPRVAGGGLDFDLLAGTLYVGGLWLELAQSETYRLQSDWLEQPRDEISPLAQAALPPPAAGVERWDFAYVEAWQQPVSAVEDNELFEVAIGGADTSSRIRNMRRVRVLPGQPGVAVSCAQGWQALIAAAGQLSRENELVSDAVLTVSFLNAGGPPNLCTPGVVAGYLGAENQAIRVQLVDATTLTWGFDNASPLYRVQLSNAGQTVTMQTLPKDEVHWPLTGQVVELLGWSAVLPNGQKIAEAAGVLARVTASYDPDSRQFAIAPAVVGFGSNWTGRADHVALSALPDGVFLYMRVWNRGADVASPLAIPFVNQLVTLGDTGIQVRIAGTTFRPGDYWVIAARPDSPQQVVPWQLQQSGRGPNGIRRFYAPLGIVHWKADGTLEAHDCRHTFTPLTRKTTCCTFTVGDDLTSQGDFKTIQDAINHLPKDGGEVCVLPGRYVENVVIAECSRVVVHGCGPRSVLVAPDGAKAALQIARSTDIVIRDLEIDATVGPGVLLGDSPDAPPKEGSVADIVLARLVVKPRDHAAIVGRAVRRVRVREVLVEAQALAAPGGAAGATAGAWPAIYLSGAEITVEDCRVSVNQDVQSVSQPRGGIQIGGRSKAILLRRNEIIGGNGNGITLGSIVWVTDAKLPETDWNAYLNSYSFYPPGYNTVIWIDGCLYVDPDPTPPNGPGGAPLTPVSEGPLFDVQILENDIGGMGQSGIAAAHVFAGDAATADAIVVERLVIAHNRIANCVGLDQQPAAESLGAVLAFGGVVLSLVVDLTIRGNSIVGNGARHTDPTCGIFVQLGEAVDIDGNRVIDNGPAIHRARPTTAQAGGIIVLIATEAMSQPLGQIFADVKVLERSLI
jgi:hypothetical protein